MLNSAEHEISLLINMKMPTIVSREISCSTMFSKKELAVVSNSRFISRKNPCSAELSMKKFYNLGAWCNKEIHFSPYFLFFIFVKEPLHPWWEYLVIVKNCICFQTCASIASGQILGKRNVNSRSVNVCSNCCSGDLCNTNCRAKGTCN